MGKDAERRFGSWEVASNGSGIKLEVRKNRDTGIVETRVEGVVGAPTDKVWKVITTPESYVKVMPRTVESVHLDETPRRKSLHCYQRLSGKPSSDRDYTLAVSWEVADDDGGKVYRRRWSVDNAKGPAPKPGVVRVEVSDGTWLLSPLPGKRTQFQQVSYIELGGSLLAMIANAAVKDSAVLILRNLRTMFPA